jgi:tetratricopeptide (TPR) repeat protein/ribonuclease BN (tRNA processing enzyme)
MSILPHSKEISTANAQALNEFEAAIWKARRYTHKNLSSESERLYREAAAFAYANDLFAEALIAQAAILELNQQYEKAMVFFEQAAKDPSNHLKGIAWFFLGSVYRERYPVQKNLCDTETTYKAMDYYRLAIDSADFSKRHWAHNNLANIYFSLGKHEDAEQHYLASLQSVDETHYITHYNLGRLCLDKKKPNKAIEFLMQALNGVGDDFDMRGACYREMGTAYILQVLSGDITCKGAAIKCWEQAQEAFRLHDEATGNPNYESGKAAVAQAKIRLSESLTGAEKSLTNDDDDVLLRWWPPEEAGPDGYSTPEERIFSKIESVGQDRYLLYNKQSNSRFSHKFIPSGTRVEGKNVLAILRGWGSATPLIEDAFSACRGGGYFLKWQDKGLVIDPGLDFVRNFRASGFHMREVDVVAVSHNHSDHNFDLAAIDDIFYEMNKRSSKGSQEWTYRLICDESTANKEFLNSESDHRSVMVPGYNNFKLYDDYEHVFDLSRAPFNLPFRIAYFRAMHGKNLKAYGIRVECLHEHREMPPVKIGFSCDTEYFDSFGTNDPDSLAQHLTGCDILVAHISQPTLAELVTSHKPKKNHLGYRGVAQLIKNTNPGLTVLGEFWAGYADMRIDLAKGIKRVCDSAAVIPSSVGLYLNPQTKEIECSNCKRWESAASISVSAAMQEFGPLSYVCSMCRLQP